MKRKRAIPAVALLLTLAAACAPADDAGTDEMPLPEVQTSAPPAELEAAADAFTAAWNQEDPAVVGAMFTEGATVVADDTATFNGRQEIQENWVQGGLPTISDLEVSDEVWIAQGQDFVGSGRFSLTATTPEGESQVTGRYEATWTRDTDGQWRVSSMRTNDDPPPMTTT